ncbi:MAG: tRNA (adenosine(37)-N6)-threonylcarbamoyltransferase complex dimerization subunit type 1 TsaB [Dechloromonas sp.]|nr:tRNA (adenosine(37)-N6)-threonylcarbamoyltransferase complex dimerization subunit type 1 TsaB [Dechloromonas sp.]
MQILSLETSTETGSCALLIDGEVIERRCPAEQSHSTTLLPLVRQLLAEASLSLAQLDAIALGIGPGAFTGLRVACGAAQGLAVAANRPVVPVVSLAAMAAATGGERVLAVLDARMGEVYAARYVVMADRWQQQGEIQVLPPEQIDLPDAAGWQVCGNALSAYPTLAARVAAAGLSAQPGILPLAAWVARLAVAPLAAGEALDCGDIAPLYIRDKVAKTVAERLAEGGRA